MNLRSLFALLFSVALVAPAFATDHDKDAAQSATEAKAKPDAAPQEKSVVTRHGVTIDGRSIAYDATAGTLIIRNDKGEPDASVFYVAYTAGDGKGTANRPVTFLYNGGPGSSSIWLHMGSFAPVRIETSSPNATPPAPYHLVPNADSLLDKTDLVFVDAIGTGFSHGIANAKDKKDAEANPDKRFWGTDQDIDAFGRFVQRYITKYNRWNSPKFLFGESYGTPRSAGLVKWLADNGIDCNGVVLLSSILNYAEHLPGLDINYVNYLPSYAAIAWYHHKLPNQPATLEPFLTQARDFARGDYQVALSRGAALTDAERDAIAAKLHQFTGLSVAYLKEANLRVNPSRFRKELLRGEGLTMGRYDARFEGVDSDSAGENPESDPSDTAISGAFTAAFNDYLVRELHYPSDVPYAVSAPAIRQWDWKHKVPGGGWMSTVPLPIMVGDLGYAMRENPHLKVLSANGWFDLATPFFATEYDLAHLGLDAKLLQNVSFAYYPSGHMAYLNVDALKQFKQDLSKFYDSAAPR
ncbi:MAG: peptidase S10 [Proteobacteria bacterium]|nr:peptidase S10 [Pseudomonadota bacterium]